MVKLAVIGVAGLCGTLARYWLSGWVDRRYGETFPAGTLMVNLAGCLLIGFLYHALEERFLISPLLRSAILIGFLGGFTTFSSYGIQTFNLLRESEFVFAGLNMLASNVLGLLLVWVGYTLSRSL